MNSDYIIGVGTDICDVARINNMLTKYGENFLDKVFTKEEIKYCSAFPNSAEHYAARFAAKEAMSKAFGTGFIEKITLKSFSVLNQKNGMPYAVFDDNAKKLFDELGAKKMSISLSHLKDYAVAFAILSK